MNVHSRLYVNWINDRLCRTLIQWIVLDNSIMRLPLTNPFVAFGYDEWGLRWGVPLVASKNTGHKWLWFKKSKKNFTFREMLQMLSYANATSNFKLKDAFCIQFLSLFMTTGFLIEWANSLYIDIFLSFRLHTSLFIFNLFMKRFHWIMKHVFYRNVIHYLHEFLLVEDLNIEFFNTLAFYLGFSKYIHKREDDTLVKFLEIALDSHTIEACLAQNKLNCAFWTV